MLILEGEVNIAIAKSLGWHQPLKDQPDFWHNPGGLRRPIPNFCNSLNEMSKAEQSLNPDQQEEYGARLAAKAGMTNEYQVTPERLFKLATIKAKQRAEIYLEVIA
jgi:hypothetical protein